MIQFWLTVAFVFGASIGSFLNVVIWRVPRGGNISSPTWSYCPQCNHRLGTWDLFPILSFLALRARCRYCHAAIAWRYPGIELLTALLFMVVVWKFGSSEWDVICYCLFASVMVCVFFIDLEHFIIPDELNLAGVLIGIAHNIGSIAVHGSYQWQTAHGVRFPASVLGLIIYSSLLYLIGLTSYIMLAAIDRRLNPLQASWRYITEVVRDWVSLALYFTSLVVPPLRKIVAPPEPIEGFTAEEIESDEDAHGLGFGDGKLAAAIGANLGWGLAVQSFFFAVFIGAAQGVVHLIRSRRKLGGRTAIPYGPAMVAGALVALFVGNQFLDWYLVTFWSFPGSPFLPSSSQG